MSAEAAGTTAGWLLEHGHTLFWAIVILTAVVVVVRVVYLVFLALADLRLRRAGGDAAAELAAWLRQNDADADPFRRGRGGHSAFYESYLQSPMWAAKRERALMLAGGACQDCGRRKATDAHHLTYDRLGRERDTDLLALCAGCHAARHGR